MKKPVSSESASALIDERIKELGDWRGKMLANVRAIVHKADPEIVEEWKWMGTPVWSHGGIVCTGETYKSVVKMTFAKHRHPPRRQSQRGRTDGSHPRRGRAQSSRRQEQVEAAATDQ